MDLLSGKRPDSNMGALGPVFGVSWALLGRSWRHLGRSWSGLGGLLGALGHVLGALGAVLEACWALLGVSLSMNSMVSMLSFDFPGPESSSGRILELSEHPGTIFKALETS